MLGAATKTQAADPSRPAIALQNFILAGNFRVGYEPLADLKRIIRNSGACLGRTRAASRRQYFLALFSDFFYEPRLFIQAAKTFRRLRPLRINAFAARQREVRSQPIAAVQIGAADGSNVGWVNRGRASARASLRPLWARSGPKALCSLRQLRPPADLKRARLHVTQHIQHPQLASLGDEQEAQA
jgi:hypothetical protein